MRYEELYVKQFRGILSIVYIDINPPSMSGPCPTVMKVEMHEPVGAPIEVGLNAVIVAVTDDTPRILTIRPLQSDDHGGATASVALADYLPSGSLDATGDRTLDLGLRRWVRDQTAIDLGYIEQLYTFGDRDREIVGGRRLLSIAYLALTRQVAVSGAGAPAWRPVYDYLPWEDWRIGQPSAIASTIAPALIAWIAQGDAASLRAARRERADIAFGLGTSAWDPNRVLDRYELLFEARLIEESGPGVRCGDAQLGRAMALDHRRIVAASLERLRGKLSYRPVVFELLPEAFTLLQLQRVVEALSGMGLHKSNFRRLVEQAQLVERTGELEASVRGRPAELFRFRREVLRERPAPGVSLPRRVSR